MYKKILLATDNSKQAEKAGEHAISMADVDGADIIVLYVIDDYYKYALPQKDLRDQLDEQLQQEGKEAVEKFKSKIKEEQCAGRCKNVNLITLIKNGKPSDVIIKTADEENVDQIIIGKSGKHGRRKSSIFGSQKSEIFEDIEKFLLGSTAEKVVRGAKVPVNVIS
jgi:nucleotide-binding universal stress UspA family protein